MNGMRLPDYHNSRVVHNFLSSNDLTDEFPLFTTIYNIAYLGAPPSTVINALRTLISEVSLH
jgi:glycerol-3-phosphate dehydrogenase